MKKSICLAAALCLLLCGCGKLLEAEYSVVEPHADRYWESAADDILRADNYQDLVNTILLLVETQEEEGTIRLYLTDVDYSTAWDMAWNACAEVRTETAIGSYSLRALDFGMEKLRNNYFELRLLPDYRRTAEDIDSIVETSSSGLIYDMALAAWEKGLERLTVRYSYLAEDEATLTENILRLQQELEGRTGSQAATPEDPLPEVPSTEEGLPPADAIQTVTPWEIHFYPPGGNSSIVEIFFHPGGGEDA